MFRIHYLSHDRLLPLIIRIKKVKLRKASDENRDGDDAIT